MHHKFLRYKMAKYHPLPIKKNIFSPISKDLKSTLSINVEHKLQHANRITAFYLEKGWISLTVMSPIILPLSRRIYI